MNSKPKKSLSIEEFKSYPGFENFTNEMKTRKTAYKVLFIYLRVRVLKVIDK